MTSHALKTGAARAKPPAFPPEYKIKVDMSKVNLPLIQNWVKQEVVRLLDNEDDIVIGMICTMLENKTPDIKKLQTDIAGFLDKDTAAFCLSLWKLCLSAQEDPNGIPKELIEAKKEELKQERLAEDKARERERELADLRDREREERDERSSRGRGGTGGRGGRGDRGYDGDYGRRPPSRQSRSPPRRFDGPPRRLDSYQPAQRGRDSGRDSYNNGPRRRQRSSSGGRSPPRRRRRRNSSSDISRSPPPRKTRASSSDNEKDSPDKHSRVAKRRRSRSPSPRRRQSSPRRSDSMRSPPPRRRRSRSRSRSSNRRAGDRSPPHRSSRDKGRRSPNELFSRNHRASDSHRLEVPSRPSSAYSTSGSERRPSQQDADRDSFSKKESTNGGADNSNKVGEKADD